MSINEIENEIIDEFSFFPEWADKYEYLIELGKKLRDASPVYGSQRMKKTER